MPIYAYRCAACGHARDVLQKMSDPLLTVCPACGAAALVKQVTAAGFQLKGSGWYVTDFKGDKAPAKSEGSAETAAPDAAKAGDAAAAPAPASAADGQGGKGEAGGAAKTKSESAPAPAAVPKAAKPAAGSAPAAKPPAAPSGGQ